MTDVRPQIAAVKAALEAACAAPVYEYDEVPGANGNPGTEPTRYVLLSLERRFVPTARVSAMTGRTGWRVSVRAVDTSIGNVENSLAQASGALNEARLTVGADTSTPVQFESAEATAWDEPKYVGTSLWTYAL